MAGAQVFNNLCEDSNKEISLKDGLACTTSRSKRRRNRTKTKAVGTVHLVGSKNLDSVPQGNSPEQNHLSSKSVSGYCLPSDLADDTKVSAKSKSETDDQLIQYSSQMDNNGKDARISNVIAQRLEKKQAKLAAKMKSKNKNKNENSQIKKEGFPNNSSSEKSNDEKQIKQLPNEPSSEIDTSEDKVVEDKTSETDTHPVIVTDAATVTKETNLSNARDSEGSSGKLVKSREEIKAEREARRQAKLKNKGPLKVIASESVTGQKPAKLNELSRKESQNEPGDGGKQVDEDQLLSGKSKAELRAERRAKQEAQRAMKDAEKLKKSALGDIKVVADEAKIPVLTEKKSNKERAIVTSKIGHQRVKLFSHLKFEQKHFEVHLMPNVHPAVVQLGLKYSSRIVLGSNARCVALLKVLKEVIMDYITPSEKEFSRALESQISTLMTFLNKCRPSSVSMINAVRHLKSHLTQLSNDISESEARKKLCDVIDTFIREQIDVAGEAICNAVQKKIANGDNILIYACSSLLYRILVESHKSGKQFTVVVVDSGPWFEGREMLRRLVDHGIKCSYVLVSALSFIMREVSKVLLGAHALLANGSVMSRAGSALVALVAKSNNVPTLVCCETYKFCERVQMDAFVYNELGNDEDMKYVKCEDYKENESSAVTLSVLYDITPADLVTAVVTEVAILPCTSVPVILRIKPSDVVS